ncbi:MAG: rhomboid family intramembrane serine protease [Betaproteobacteria bacterium]
MLIIPVSRRPDWRHPPLVTLLLILLNCLIYFGLQSGDDQRTEKAYRYYADSTLPGIELPRFIKYLEDKGKSKAAASASAALAQNNWPRVLRAMESDTNFMKRLREGSIILPNEINYSSWQRQRQEFDRMKQSNLVERFGFKPAEPTLSGLIGHMFLHGSFDHLLGNMAILFIVGYMVEEALGKRRYLAFYLLAGIGAAGFDLVFNANRMIPGIGASGAISGVMAMFVVIYGMRKIRFFYWVLIYFDFFRAPAIVILPLWIANELYQYLFNHGSHINYMAHLGGFITGAALIGAQRAFGKARMAAPEQEAPIDTLPADLAKIDSLLGALRVDEARVALRKIADKHPQDLLVLGRYYKVAHHAPASDDYHHAAALIFALPDDHPASTELIYETFTEYLKLAKPSVRFSVRQLITLIRRMARTGHADDAERLLRVLSLRAPQDRHLPGLLMLVADGFRRANNPAMRDATLLRLQQDFPNSDEARNAAVAGR